MTLATSSPATKEGDHSHHFWWHYSKYHNLKMEEQWTYLFIIKKIIEKIQKYTGAKKFPM